jgi:hypothetical protein
MKNEHQENVVLRGPLILMVPASNLVAIMSLDWLDGTNQKLFPRKRAAGLGESIENSERPRRAFEGLSRAAFATAQIKVRKLVVYKSRRIDHDAVNTRGNRGVKD